MGSAFWITCTPSSKSTSSVAPSGTPLIVRMVPDHGCAVSFSVIPPDQHPVA
jgi:hypothetical protein